MVYLGRQYIAILLLLIAFGLCQGDPDLKEYSPAPATCRVTEAILPSWLGGGFYITSTEHFYVAHDVSNSESQRLAGCLESVFNQFYLYFGRFGFELHRPEMPLGWISFSRLKHFSQYARRADRMDLSRLGGYYSARTNHVAIVRTLERDLDSLYEHIAQPEDAAAIAAISAEQTQNQFIKIAHELAHQLAFNSGLQKRGVMYPLWVSEGLATQYETELSYCRNTNIARRDRLLEMLACDRLIPLDELIILTQLPVTQSMREDVYAQAWGFFNFLLMHHTDQLKDYLDTLYSTNVGYREIPILQTEFTDRFGATEVLQQEWIEHIQASAH